MLTKWAPATLALAITLTGCTTLPTQPSISVSSQSRSLSLSIDSRDYNEVAAYMYDSLVQSDRIKKGEVVALGPVSLRLDGDYDFDARRLQEKIQVITQRARLFEFNFAVDAMEGKNAASERYKIMQLQWEKENSVDAEDLSTFGKLAKIDYLIFGRLSSNTARSGGRTEVTYTYNWKLGKCVDGLLIWTDEKEFSKSR